MPEPQTISQTGLGLAVALVWGFTVGCANNTSDSGPRTPQITRAEAPAAPDPGAVAQEPDPLAVQSEPTPDAGLHDDPAAGVSVEAMIGQIAGRPIFAHHVLNGLEEQLASLGRRLPPVEFRQKAGELIFENVQALVEDALLRDEASRSLAPEQRQGLEQFVASRREEFLRQFGQGSLALAERRILEETGKSLDQNLRDFRTQVIIGSYINQNVNPLINVSRRDIERYYRDNYETFNPPTRRQLLLIYAADEPAAAELVAQLDAGTPFAELAASEANTYPGKDTPLSIESDASIFGPAIDPSVQGLEEGQWAGPLPNRGQQWFVYVAELDKPESRTLFEAQVDIERALRTRQDRELKLELFDRLRRDARFTDVGRMTEAVLEIATGRYASR